MRRSRPDPERRRSAAPAPRLVASGRQRLLGDGGVPLPPPAARERPARPAPALRDGDCCGRLAGAVPPAQMRWRCPECRRPHFRRYAGGALARI